MAYKYYINHVGGLVRSSADIGDLYRYRRKDRGRTARCQQCEGAMGPRGKPCVHLPRAGDLCLCLNWCGDCFHEYGILRAVGTGFWRLAQRFHSYEFGERAASLSEQEFHRLMAGLDAHLPSLQR